MNKLSVFINVLMRIFMNEVSPLINKVSVFISVLLSVFVNKGSGVINMFRKCTYEYNVCVYEENGCNLVLS